MEVDGGLARADLATLAATRSLVGASDIDRTMAGSHANCGAMEPFSGSPDYGSEKELNKGILVPASGGHETKARRGTLAEFFRKRASTADEISETRSTSAGALVRRSPVSPGVEAARSVSPVYRHPESSLRGSPTVWRESPMALEPSTYEHPESESSLGDQAMSTWLELQDVAPLTSYQVADWLRVLPTTKVSRETKKDLARRVLHFKLNGDDFHHMLAGGRWAELGIKDERESVLLLKNFKQRQQESMMAEAARQTAKLNLTKPVRKGEFLVALH